MAYLNMNQCGKLDAILKSFDEGDYLDGKEVLSIEPVERKANALINILVDRGFVNRIDVEESMLPLAICLDFSVDIFLENGGFVGEMQRKEKLSWPLTNITIHSTGHGNTINTGSNNSIQSHNHVSFGSVEQLRNELRAQKVEDTDIAEICEIVQNEQPNGKQLGPGVKNWIQKMIGKSLDSSWEIGISAAGGVLAEVINRYYGL